MLVFEILFPFVIFLSGLSLCSKFKRILSPPFIIIMWWSFWTWLSNFGLFGLYIPSVTTQLLVLALCGGIFTGAMLGRNLYSRSLTDQKLQSKVAPMITFIAASLLVIFSYYSGKALVFILNNGVLNYRGAALGGKSASVLFGSSLEELFFLYCKGLVVLVALWGVMKFTAAGSKRWLFVSILLVAMDSFTQFGLTIVYILAVFLIFSRLMTKQRAPCHSGVLVSKIGRPKHNKLFSVQFLGLIVLLLVMGGMRLSGSEENTMTDSLLNALRTFGVQYHTVGFILFDQEINNPSSPLHQITTYGRCTFGGLELVLSHLLKPFTDGFYSVAYLNGIYLNVFRGYGWYEGTLYMGNAYYTALFGLYMDGGVVAVVLLPALYGFILSSRYMAWLHEGKQVHLLWLCLLVFGGMFSIFANQFEGLRFWVPVIFLLISPCFPNVWEPFKAKLRLA